MKRWFVILIAVLAMTSLVAAQCAPATPPPTVAPAATEAPPEKAKITITFWNGVGPPENVVLSKLIAEFNATNKDGITVQETVMDWATLYSKILLDYKAGNAPDVSTMQQTTLLQEVDLGVLAPIDQLVSASGLKKEDFVEGAWNATFINGKQYAVPNDMHPLALYYNVKLFKEAGLDPAKPPTNKEEFLSYLQKLTKGTSQYGLGLAYSGGIPFRVWMSLLWQHKGEDVLNADRTKAAFNTPAGVESLQLLQDLVYKYKVVPEKEQSPDDDFMKGIVAMDITGPWAMYDFNKAEGLEYETAPLPAIYDQPATWGDSHELVLPDTKKQANMEAGMKLIKFLSDNNLTWTREAGHMPVRKAVLQSDDFKKLEKSQAFAKSLEFAHYYPAIVKQSEVFGREPTSPFVMMIEAIMLNKATPQEAIATAEKAINDILARK
jgi:multiple sugar transport system substrate-binding protein